MPLREDINNILRRPDCDFRKSEFDPALCGYIVARYNMVNRRPAYSYSKYKNYLNTREDLSLQEKSEQLVKLFVKQDRGLPAEVFPLVVEKDINEVMAFRRNHPELQLITSEECAGEDPDKYIIGIGYIEQKPYSVVYSACIADECGFSFYKGKDILDISDLAPEITRHSPWLLETITDEHNLYTNTQS